MMHDGHWFGMGGDGIWTVLVVVAVAALAAWLFVRMRPRSGG